MKAVIIVIAIWTWLTLYTSGQDDITLVVSGQTTQQAYANFLTSVRNAVKASGKTCHGLPMAAGQTAKSTFVGVRLQSASGNVTRLGFQQSDLYLEGYADRHDGACRYRIFTDSNPNIQPFLCGTNDTPGRINKIGYAKRYEQIEKKAGHNRSQFGLRMAILGSKIDRIYGKTNADRSYARNEAKFLLSAIQMVAEATRFKYIEDKIKQNNEQKRGYVPDQRAISLEDNWSTVSKLIAAQTDPNASFKMPDDMKDENGKEWTEDTVNNLKSNYISLLTYVSNCKTTNNFYGLVKSYDCAPTSIMYLIMCMLLPLICACWIRTK